MHEEERNEPVPLTLDDIRQRRARGLAPTFGDPNETQSRKVLRSEISRLRDKIEEELPGHASIGHNHPPEPISLSLELILEVKEAAIQIDEETATQVPNIDAVVEATGRLENVLIWLGNKLDMAVDSFMKMLGKLAAGAVAGLAVVPLVKYLATVYQAGLEWLDSMLPLF